MTQAYDLDRIRQLALVDHSINDTLGIEFVEVTEGRVVGTMPVNQHSIQPYGILHGGASVVLAESIGSLGSAVLAMAEGKQAVGVEVNANHLRPVQNGDTVTATATLAHRGRTLHVWDIRLENSAGKPTCLCRLTVALRDPR